MLFPCLDQQIPSMMQLPFQSPRKLPAHPKYLPAAPKRSHNLFPLYTRQLKRSPLPYRLWQMPPLRPTLPSQEDPYHMTVYD